MVRGVTARRFAANSHSLMSQKQASFNGSSMQPAATPYPLWFETEARTASLIRSVPIQQQAGSTLFWEIN